MSEPLPETVKVPLLYVALPARPTAPISTSVQPGGKAAEAWTDKLIVVVLLRLPLVPITVTVAVPVAAVLPADSVSVLVVVVLNGLNEAVTPDGSPEADRLTLPLKLLIGLTVIVFTPLEPWMIVRLFGEADSEKSGAGGGFTINVTFVLWIRLPLVPVTVTL